VGDWFLEFDALVGDEDEYADVMASLTRVGQSSTLPATMLHRPLFAAAGRGR
jgi:hypothetical protein